MDLRLMRVRARLTVGQVAQAAGWSRSRGSAIEATEYPTRRAVSRYLDALQAAATERAGS
jgi:hypothetical protein